MLDNLVRNLRYALRALARAPGFTAVAVLTLGLGIGSSTAIFSIVHSVLFRPLGYAQNDRLIQVYTEFPTEGANGFHRFWASRPEYIELKRDLTSWQSFDAWSTNAANIGGDAEPLRVPIAVVTGTLLQTLGVQPLKGRLITPADDAYGAPSTAVLSFSLWQRAFGGAPGIVGREILVNGEKYGVLGVLPASFRFPPGELNAPELWTPLRVNPADGNWGNHFLYLLGRLKPGVSLAQAVAEMNNYVRKTGAGVTMGRHNFDPVAHTLVGYPLQDEVTRGVRPALLMLLGAVAFVLLIACVNVANLLLARAEARQREVAVRMAMGADAKRLLAQFITEGITLAVGGAIVGFALAFVGVRLVVLTQAGVLPRADEIGLHLPVLLFSVALTAATGIVFGLAPFLHLIRGALSTALKSGGRNTAAGSSLWFRRLLVSGEIALALVLLIGTGLMVQAFWRLQSADPGFHAERVITMSVALPGAQYPKNDDVFGYWERLLKAVKLVPGVSAVSLADELPPRRNVDANDTQIEGLNVVPGGPQNNIDFWNEVTPGYFEALGIRLIEGRYLDQRDIEGAAPTVVVNQAMARLYYGNRSALGRRIRPGGAADPWRTIVGVVSDARNAGLDKPAGTEIYMPFQQLRSQAGGLRGENIVVKTAGEPLVLTGPIVAAIHSLDRALPVTGIQTMEQILTAEQAHPRFLSLVMTLFSALALTLAAVGIYGVVSYSVAQRSGEFGIRMAIGASAGHVRALVIREGLLLAAAGVVGGAFAALLLTRSMQSLLFGTQSSDAWTFALMACALTIVVLCASLAPAQRAARVDPATALRLE